MEGFVKHVLVCSLFFIPATLSASRADNGKVFGAVFWGYVALFMLMLIAKQ